MREGRPLRPDADSPSRRIRWRGGLLAAAVLAGLAVMAVERHRQDDAYVMWARVRESLAAYLNPVRDATRGSLIGLRRASRLWQVEQENQELRKTLLELRLEQQLTSEQLRRLQRLSGLGEWSGPPELRFVPADVTGLVTNEESAEFIINRGRADGVHPRDPVVALGGLIGLVQSTDRHYAQVQGLSDPLSAMGAVTAHQRARGVVYGRGRGKPLEFVPENEMQPIEIGAPLLTSGFANSLYPKGIIIGKIVDRGVNSFGLPYGVVEPAMPFDSVEEVLLVLPSNRAGLADDALSTRTLGSYTISMPLVDANLLSTATLTTTGTAVTTGTLATTATLTTSGTLVTSASLGLPPAMRTATQSSGTTTTTNARPASEKPRPARASEDDEEADSGTMDEGEDEDRATREAEINPDPPVPEEALPQ